MNTLETLPRQKPQEQSWFLFSNEPKDMFPQFSDELFLKAVDEWVLSYELDSFAPHPAYSIDPAQVKAAIPRTKTKGAVAFISNCWSEKRRLYLEEFMKHMEVDSYGSCHHNKNSSSPRGDERGKIEIQSDYLFSLVFENTILFDYVSEKLAHAYLAVSLPVYYGAPNIDEFVFDKKSIVKASDFESPKQLAEYLKFLQSNQTAYEEYFHWRELPISSWQIPKPMRIQIPDWRCKICQFLHEKFQKDT